MASIQRIVSRITGAVSYRAQVRAKGRAPDGKTFPNRKEAQQWAQSLEAAIRENRYFPHQKASRTLFAEVVNRYRDTVLPGQRASNRETVSRQLDWWSKRFAGRTLAEITPDLVAAAREYLATTTYARAKPKMGDDGKEVSSKQYTRSGATVNRYLAALSHLFSIASREWQLTDRNPVREINKKKESRGRVRFLSDLERQRLLDACAKSKWKPLHTLVLLAISTGARRGELIGLKWVDVDLKAGRATIHETKNGDLRVLPLVGRALEALREMKLQGSAKSDFVFSQPSGFPGPYEHFDHHWYDALNSVEITNFRFHDLRHSTASYLAQQGASLLEIADTLGHRSMAMVKRYAHLAQTHKVSAIEKMAATKGL